MASFIWFLACIIPGLIAKYTFASSYKNLNDRGAYMMASMLSNIGTLSGLCAFIVYGIQGFAYLQIVAMFQTLFTLSVCFPLANYYHSKASRRHHQKSNQHSQIIIQSQSITSFSNDYRFCLALKISLHHKSVMIFSII